MIIQKWKKMQKKKIRKKNITKKSFISYGIFGIKTKEPVIFTQKQLEASRKNSIRKFKKQVKMWILPKLNSIVTNKPLGVRMGKGKGQPSQRIKKALSNNISHEIGLLKYNYAKRLSLKITKKLPCLTKFFWKGK